MNTYVKGNLVRVAGSFTDENGAAMNPTVVKCAVLPPATVTPTTYTYGTDAAVVRDSTGHYHVDLDASTEGLWRYRWYSTGSGQAAAESEFQVRSSPF